MLQTLHLQVSEFLINIIRNFCARKIIIFSNTKYATLCVIQRGSKNEENNESGTIFAMRRTQRGSLLVTTCVSGSCESQFV